MGKCIGTPHVLRAQAQWHEDEIALWQLGIAAMAGVLMMR